MKITLFNISLHTQSIVCATVDSQFLEYLGCITLTRNGKGGVAVDWGGS